MVKSRRGPSISTPKMRFEPFGREIEIGRATSVLEVALSGGIPLEHSCGGMGSCTTCRVLVESDPTKTSPRTELEEEIAQGRGFKLNERLSCQLAPTNGLVIRVPRRRI